MTDRPQRFLRLPQTPETRAEALVLGGIAILFLALLAGALGHARREYRDGLRREQLRDVKAELERWYNETGSFPPHPSGDLGWCGSTDDPEDWFFVAFLQRERKRVSPLRDPRPSAEFRFRYCPTVLLPAEENGKPLAAGFFLEATLENHRPDSDGFNTEHNIFERTANEKGRTLYRICGGVETQCGTEHP